MMLPGVTVVPATVWLAVCVAMVGASNFHPSRLTPDQYAPLISHRHGLHRGTEEDQPLSKFLNDSDEDQYIEDMAGLQPKEQDPAKNQPVSISISTYWKDQDVADQDVADQAVADQADLSMRKSSSTGRLFAPQDLELLKHLEKNLLHLRMENSAAEDFSPLLQDKQLFEYAGQQLLDQNNNVQETSEPARSPPRESPPQPEDPFVADDTFQDQGPGSVEIYKLDLLRERLLPNPMPASKPSMNGKSKVPKKTVQNNEKTKATEYKAASPKMFHKQSNSFDDHSSDTPPIADPFSVGGVPELQVGCEGLAASRQKRSIDSASKDQEGDLWSEVTPISLDIDYDVSEEKDEEIDELFKLKKLETTTKGPKQNRGDIEATLYAEFVDGKKFPDKLPVRGDLGKSSATADSATLTPMTVRNERKSEEPRGYPKVKRSVQSEDTPTGERPGNQMRKILWIKEPKVDPLSPGSWGFGENEGVVSSDELQTENQRRRHFYEQTMAQGELRRRQEGQSRGEQDRSRSDREELPEQGQMEEKRSVPQDWPSFAWQREDERRRLEEERNRRIERRREEAFARSQGWAQQTSSPRPRWEQQEEEARRRQHEEEARRRQNEEEARRRQHEEEARRRQHEEEVRRRQEWMLRTRQKEEEERRKQARVRSQSSNTSLAANENGPREQWEREKKLREQTWNRKRLEEEGKLQDYVRRNQPVVIPRNVTNDSTMYWRRIQEAGRDDRSRYPSFGGGRRDHGPSATMNYLPRSYEDEARRRNEAWRTERERTRERLEEQRLREEARMRELEVQKLQSRRYEEERLRIEAERRAAQEHAGRTSPLENTGSPYWDRRRLEDHSRRQETSPVPINLVANETRRAAEHERQVEEQRRRMEDTRRRIENARRRPDGYRTMEARENQERARDEREQRRRQEVARLNALPVLASILIRPSSPPTITTKLGGEGWIPNGKGKPVTNFPAAPTQRPPVKSLSPCVWAVVKCCPSNTNRLVMCFESMGCPGANWDPNPCRVSITKAARQQVMQYYEEAEKDDDF
ncbi:uncharacterized protein LOC143355160 [Halictus rubicundus]|uniref:uncharacterized protein LOC143355160 n=1 Tax=Halictus rubicundus TaxID=77578 RepID=UPI004035B25B